MPKYQPSSIAEPIEFTLDGREVSIAKITSKMLDDMSAIGGKSDALSVLEVFVPDVRELDPDMREVVPLVSWLSDVINEGLGVKEKNAGATSPSSPPPSPDSSDIAT